MVNPRERNQRMKSLFGNVDPDALAKQPSPPPAEADKRRVGSAAVKSMDRAFVSIEEENRRLSEQLLASEQIVELDPHRVAPSFVSDRLTIDADPAFAVFVEGIKEAGQKLPILVRPLTDKPGHYQAAYGHRRLRACQILKRPVKAVVRQMTDEELVINQGIENSERLNLSFIEQALFAMALKGRGYTREIIGKALGRKEGQSLGYISTITNIAAVIPGRLIHKIGSAPAVGRPKWERLAALVSDGLSPDQETAIDVIGRSSVWIESDSNGRFALMLKALETSVNIQPDVITVAVRGGALVKAKRSDTTTKISIPDRDLPGFSEWLLQRLPELVDRFDSNQEGPEMP
jgi:ParB family chromosome partitioning protein